MVDTGCGYNPVCGLAHAATQGITNGGISALSDATSQAYGKIAAGFANAWMIVPDPQTATSSTNSAAVGQYGKSVGAASSTMTSTLGSILGYVSWSAIIVAVLSVAALGVGLVVRRRSSTGQEFMVRWLPVFTAIGMICSAGAIASAVAKPIVNGNESTAIYFLQANTAWLMMALVAIAIIVTAVVMLVKQRGEPLRDLAVGVGKMAFASAAGAAVTSLVIQGLDSWSWNIMDAASSCPSGVQQASCFGKSLEGLLALASTSAIGQLGVIILGCIAIVLLIVQMALFLIRSALLPLLIGLLPLGYAAALVPGGKNMSRRLTGWVVAFVLYKPAAAIIYATAMVLTGSGYTFKDPTGLFNMIYGLILVAAAAVALPALIRLCVPAVEAVASGMGAATVLGMAGVAGAEGMGELASGAIRRGVSSGGGGESSAPSGAASAGGGRSASSGGGGGGAAASGGGAAGAGGGAAGGGGAAAAAPGAGVALMVAEKGKQVAQGAAQAVSSAVDSPSGSGAQPASSPYEGSPGSGGGASGGGAR